MLRPDTRPELALAHGVVPTSSSAKAALPVKRAGSPGRLNSRSTTKKQRSTSPPTEVAATRAFTRRVATAPGADPPLAVETRASRAARPPGPARAPGIPAAASTAGTSPPDSPAPRRGSSAQQPMLSAAGRSPTSDPAVTPALGGHPSAAEYITNADFSRLLALLRRAYGGASGSIPLAAFPVFFGETADITEPPLAPHAFPGSADWEATGPEIAAVLHAHTGEPRTHAIADVRAAFTAAFPTASAADLPPRPDALRAILAHPSSSVLERDINVGYLRKLPAHHLLLPNRDGATEILTLAARLLDAILIHPERLAREVLDMERDAAAFHALTLRRGLQLTLCPARRFARGTSTQLASDLTCYSTPVGPASSTPAPTTDANYARSRSLDAVESCLRWLWRALSYPPDPWIPLPRSLEGRRPLLRDWDTRWAAVRDLVNRHFP